MRSLAILVLALGLLAAPMIPEAQQAGKVYRIGALFPQQSPQGPSRCRRAFEDGLAGRGYVKGQNIAVEWRYAEGLQERVTRLAEELVSLPVDVLVVSNSDTAIRARSVAGAVPIVVVAGGDLVAAGLVKSLAHPRSNVTGLQILQPDLAAKRLELLSAVVPGLSRVGILVPRTKTRTEADAIPDSALRALESGSRSLSLALYVQEVRDKDDFTVAFSAFSKERVGAVTVLGSPFSLSQRGLIADLATRHRLPTVYEFREHVDAGGLMSYGANLPDLCRQVTVFVDKILRGAKPADLPVEQPSKLELVVNLRTARKLGLTLPQLLLLRADHAVE